MYTYTSSTYTRLSPYGGPYNCVCAGGGVSASRHLPLTIDHLPLFTDLSYNNVPLPRCTSRGYTGHEHLVGVNLINMNGRVYDPLMGMFLSPDPVLQAPNDPLNYNRYSYCLNNPLKYTDPSGEFAKTWLTMLGDFYHTVFHEGGAEFWNKKTFNNAWREFDPTAQWSVTNKAYRIDAGFFQTSGDTYFERGLQLLSRATWERYQYMLGNNLAHLANIMGGVKEVNYFSGTTVVDTDFYGNPFSTSPYIFGDGFRKSHGKYYMDHEFVHEYGHIIQSRYLGPSYLSLVGMPSIKGTFLRRETKIGVNQNRWFEALASRYGGRYFNEHYSQFELNSYQTGNASTYLNPRRLDNNTRSNNNAFDRIEQFHWSDWYLHTNIPFGLMWLWQYWR